MTTHCNCNGNLIPSGNDFYLAVTLKSRSLVDGEVVETPFDFEAADTYNARIYGILDGKTLSTMVGLKDGSTDTVVVDAKGVPLIRAIGVEVTGTVDGRAFRAAEKGFLSIVEFNGEARVVFTPVTGGQQANLVMTLTFLPSAAVVGKNAYEIWKEEPGNQDKTLADFIYFLGHGESAYEIAVRYGYTGTEAEYNMLYFDAVDVANTAGQNAQQAADTANEMAAQAQDAAELADAATANANNAATAAAATVDAAIDNMEDTLNAAIAAQDAEIASKEAEIDAEFATQTALINQKQMEVGAVPSDLNPKKNSTNYVVSGSIADLIPHTENNTYQLTAGMLVIAKSTNSDYGNAVSHSDTAYKASEYVYVKDAAIIKDCPIITKSNNSDVYNRVGYVFYDSSKQPISGTVTASQGTFALSTTDVEVPSGAVYFRFTHNTGNLSMPLTIEFNASEESQVANKREVEEMQQYIPLIEKLPQTKEITTSNIQRKFIDAKATSSTYGQEVAISDNYYYASPYIDVNGAYVIENVKVISGSGDPDKRARCGYVFYNSSKQAIKGVLTATATSAGTKIITISDIPEGAAYLRVTLRDSATWQWNVKTNCESPLNVASQTELDARLSTFDYVMASSLNLPDMTYYTYAGKHIPTFETRYRWSVKSYGYLGNRAWQSHAIYDKWLFAVDDTHSSIKVYDLENKAVVTTVSITANSHNHANNACFGTLYYDVGDDFPVLYISGSKAETDNIVEAFRVQYDSDNDEWSMTLIQTITLPTVTSENQLYWNSAAIDIEDGFMWVYASQNINWMVWAKFAIPSLSESAVFLTDLDMKDWFKVHDGRPSSMQGSYVSRGVAYMLCGVPSWGQKVYMKCYDLSAHSILNILNFTKEGLTFEPEGIGLYEEHLIISDYEGNLYKIYLE